MVKGYATLIQYVTAALLVFLILWHVLLRFPPVYGAKDLVDTMTPERLYEEITSSRVLLFLLLVATLFHGINGARGVLIEWFPDKRWEILVNVGAFLAFVALMYFGLLTILYVPPVG